jgi:hypothetical protein
MPECGEPADEAQPLRRIQLVGIRRRDRLGPAVSAGQIAGPRHLPVDASGRRRKQEAGRHPPGWGAAARRPISTYARFPAPW